MYLKLNFLKPDDNISKEEIDTLHKRIEEMLKDLPVEAHHYFIAKINKMMKNRYGKKWADFKKI